MISLRKATEKDIEFLYSLREATMKSHIENEGLNYIFEEQHARVLFSYENSQIITHENKSVGLLKVDKSTNPWKIIQIQVSPKFQNLGIGTRILQKIIEESNKTECSIELNVLKKNTAQRLYKRLGFIIYKEREHAYIMLRTPSACQKSYNHRQ